MQIFQVFGPQLAEGVSALGTDIRRAAGSLVLRLAVSGGPLENGRSNGWSFITPWNIGICIDMVYPVDRWNELGGC
jgi:hypothetical protein